MKWVLGLLIFVHGFIHLMGPAKAFGLAELPQLKTPLSRPMGLLWLLAAVLTVITAVALLLWPRVFWALALAAAITSQLAIVTAWPDAKYGTLLNIVLLVAAFVGFTMFGPTSLPS